jgi:hypothetical protein
MEQNRVNDINVSAGVVTNPGLPIGEKMLKTHYKIDCYRPGKMLRDARGRFSGREMAYLWTEEFDNLVVDAGLNDSLDKHLKGAAYTAAWYVGVVGATPTFAAADTMGGGHAGWTEQTTYDEANRPTLTLGTVSGKSVDNSVAKAVFTISGSITLGGAFVVSVSTKGGSTGVLYGGGVFSQNRALVDNDVLNVTITCTAAAS